MAYVDGRAPITPDDFGAVGDVAGDFSTKVEPLKWASSGRIDLDAGTDTQISVNFARISNVANPTNSQDAINQQTLRGRINSTGGGAMANRLAATGTNRDSTYYDIRAGVLGSPGDVQQKLSSPIIELSFACRTGRPRISMHFHEAPRISKCSKALRK